MEVRPRALAHRGTVEAAGFAFDAGMLGTDEARRRILKIWTPGAAVHRVDALLVVRLARPVWMRVNAAPGAPLVDRDGVLLAAPLDAREMERLAPSRGDVVFARDGVARVFALDACERERPETWIDLAGIQLARVVSLGAPPPPPRVVAAPGTFEARARLGGVAPAPPELDRVIAALRGGVEQGTGEGGRFVPAARAWLGRAAAKAASWLTGLRNLARRLAAEPLGGALATSPPTPGMLDRLAGRMRRAAAWLLRASMLDELVGRRQAEYIGKMMAMFERGDVAEGLRHAIPLSTFEGLRERRPSFGVPRPRADLRITPARATAGSSIGMSADLMDEIRRLYRAAFERLAARGRVEEAAFVLAELLRADEEAVAFLERHGRLKLAAEMAEARNLPHGLVVRLWFLAGDRHRAVAVARRTGAFADAVERLERADKQQAEVLRLLWAGSLADAGDYARAVDVAWPVVSARRLATEWMNRAIEAGGVAGARMLAKRLVEFPGDAARLKVLETFDDEAVENAATRTALAEGLLKERTTAESATVARAGVRAMLRDAGLAPLRTKPDVYKALVGMAGDGALRTDVPAALPASALSMWNRPEPVTMRIEAADAGTRALTDAVLLPDGRSLVALGEAGAWLLSRDGRRVATFDEPAHRLVASHHGDRVLALAPRGDVWRLARIDLRERRASSWCEARIDAWEEQHDGSLWFIAAGEDFYAIDVTADRFDALWRVPDTGARTIAIARNQHQVLFLTEGDASQLWRYEFPMLRLRVRNDMLAANGWARESDARKTALAADTRIADASECFTYTDEGERIIPANEPIALRLFKEGMLLRTIVLKEGGGVAGTPSICTGLVAAPVLTDSGGHVFVVAASAHKVSMEVHLGGAGRVSARATGAAITIVDDRGRFLAFDSSSGMLVRDFRV